jgi:hypothetical protein
MISMFNSHNSTDMWAVLVDGRLGLYPDKTAAEVVYNSVSSIEDSAHGAMQIIPPHYTCSGCLHTSHDDIANHVSEAIDLPMYMAETEAALLARVAAAPACDFDFSTLFAKAE